MIMQIRLYLELFLFLVFTCGALSQSYDVLSLPTTDLIPIVSGSLSFNSTNTSVLIVDGELLGFLRAVPALRASSYRFYNSTMDKHIQIQNTIRNIFLSNHKVLNNYFIVSVAMLIIF